MPPAIIKKIKQKGKENMEGTKETENPRKVIDLEGNIRGENLSITLELPSESNELTIELYKQYLQRTLTSLCEHISDFNLNLDQEAITILLNKQLSVLDECLNGSFHEDIILLPESDEKFPKKCK